MDIASVAPQVAFGSFYNSGQICVATKRIYTHKDIYQPFLEAMVSFSQHIKVGMPKEDGVMLSPIQNEMQYEKVKTFFEDGKKNGYKFAAGQENVEEGKEFSSIPRLLIIRQMIRGLSPKSLTGRLSLVSRGRTKRK